MTQLKLEDETLCLPVVEGEVLKKWYNSDILMQHLNAIGLPTNIQPIFDDVLYEYRMFLKEDSDKYNHPR